MKKYLLFLFVLASTIFFHSCNEQYDDPEIPDGMIRDYSPFFLQIEADDGINDLLNPSFAGNICQKITVTYNGENYTYTPPSKLSPKAYIATFKGLYLVPNYDIKTKVIHYTLQFGDFESTKNYKNEKIIVTWPDGMKDEIVYSLAYIPGNKAIFDFNFTLNGKKVDNALYLHRTISSK